MKESTLRDRELCLLIYDTLLPFYERNEDLLSDEVVCKLAEAVQLWLGIGPRAICRYCGKVFSRMHHSQIYCDSDCSGWAKQ